MQTKTIAASEQTKDMEALWESALVASIGNASLALNLSLDLGSPSLSLNLNSTTVGPMRGAASYVGACLSKREGQEWGPTACLKVFTRIWGQLGLGTCLRKAAICTYCLFFLPFSSSYDLC